MQRTQLDIPRESIITVISQYDYAYDEPVQRTFTSKSDTMTEVSKSFESGYNSRSELVSATLGNDNYSYGFDAIGNRATSSEAGTALTYAANNLNQYTEIASSESSASFAFNPTYDADGNATLIRTSTGTWTIAYNAENRPIRFENAGIQTVVECGYDSQGRRFEKKVTVAGTTTLHHRYIYRGYLQIAALDLTRAAHPALWLVTWDPSQSTATRPLALQKDGTWFTYGYDITKNVCELFGPNGYIRTAYSYAPFGAVTESGDVSQPFQWSSEFYDSELDLVYYNYRHYSPSLGRFLSRDPIAEQGGLNLYACMGNQPVSITDCLGYAKLEDVLEMLTLIELARERCFKCKKVVSILGNLEDEIYEENEESIGEIMPLVRDFTSAISVYTNGKKKVVDFTVFLEDVFGKESINKDALKDLSGGLGRVTNILNKISAISDFGDSLRRKDGLDLFLTVTNQFPVTQILTGHLRDAYRSALEWSRNMKYIPNNKMLIREARKACRERNGCCTAETILVGLRK